MSLIYYMPNYTDIERDPECEMDGHVANTWSVWIICGAMACCSLGWILAYLCKRARNASTIEMFEFIGKSTIWIVLVQIVITLFGLGLFFYISLFTTMGHINSACFHGLTLVDFIIYIIFMVVCLPVALAFTILMCCCVCICPIVLP